MSETLSEAPLEDLMVAMDVVDTVRHRELIVDRELDAVGRRGRLLERLREIYKAQGIEVTDAALEAGVDALEEERFGYTPTPDGLSAKLARLYVRRERWRTPVLVLAGLALAIWLFWLFSVAMPERRLRAELPATMGDWHTRITVLSKDPEVVQRADELLRRGREAVADDRIPLAETAVAELQSLHTRLDSSYEIRIVSGPDQISGIWRIPDVNEAARNYYLIVEAITPDGTAFPLEVRNEETGRTQRVSKWGLRVSEDTFEAVAADKRDDGIIQDDVVGVKVSGELDHDYRVPTTGATITDW